MATLEIMGNEVEFVCTAYTTTVYEQAFRDDPYERVTGDLVADVMGVLRVGADDFVDTDEDGNIIVAFDYTRDNWQAEKRALWSMMRTANEIAKTNGRKVEAVPSYREWDKSLVAWEPDLKEVSLAVCNELQRGLFRARPAATEEQVEA